MAEVLITLAIIGVVAAITIPVVVHKYQQKAYYTQFLKVYNTMNNAIDSAIAKSDEPDVWLFDEDNPGYTTDKYIYSNLNVISTCEPGNSGCGDYGMNLLSGSASGATFGEFLAYYGLSKLANLADGSSLGVAVDGGSRGLTNIGFLFDTNGAKGPNTLGRDIFIMVYANEDDESTAIKRGWHWIDAYEKGGEDDGSGGLTEANCDPGSDGEENGLGCAGRLLAEGKMSY